MTTAEFKKKWSRYTGKESSAYQEHFNDLCQLLGQRGCQAPRAGGEEIMRGVVLFNQDAGRGLGVGLAQKGLTMTRTTVAARINNGISLTQR